MWLEGKQDPATDFDLKKEGVAGERLAPDDVAQLEGEALEGGERA